MKPGRELNPRPTAVHLEGPAWLSSGCNLQSAFALDLTDQEDAQQSKYELSRRQSPLSAARFGEAKVRFNVDGGRPEP